MVKYANFMFFFILLSILKDNFSPSTLIILFKSSKVITLANPAIRHNHLVIPHFL